MRSFDWSPYDEMANEMKLDQEIEKKMHNYRVDSVRRLVDSIAMHPEFALKVASCIIYAFRESSKEAQEVIRDLALDEMEISAIKDNFSDFRELYEKHFEYEYLSNIVNF